MGKVHDTSVRRRPSPGTVGGSGRAPIGRPSRPGSRRGPRSRARGPGLSLDSGLALRLEGHWRVGAGGREPHFSRAALGDSNSGGSGGSPSFGARFSPAAASRGLGQPITCITERRGQGRNHGCGRGPSTRGGRRPPSGPAQGGAGSQAAGRWSFPQLLLSCFTAARVQVNLPTIFKMATGPGPSVRGSAWHGGDSARAALCSAKSG